MTISQHAGSADGLDNPAVFRAVEEYLAAIQLGRRPDRSAFLAEHPDIAAELAECLDALEFVQAAASSLEGTDKQPADQRGAGLPEPGTTLGDYRIVREVGRGGMGVVYEAEQLSLGRRIALKVLPFAMTLDPRQLQRFKNEAHAAACLHHANIVPVYAVGCERGVHFYAMQFIEGRTLSALITELRRKKHDENRKTSNAGGTDPESPTTEESLPTNSAATDCELLSSYATRSTAFGRDVARLGVQAAEALDCAHQMGVIHRDVKPGNLMVEDGGRLWVTDFGLARFQGDTALTAPGDVVGTLRYMPPEQAMAFRDLVDHRADVYSLGATLYELLTLEPPFNGRDRRELLRQIEHEEPRPLRRLNPAVPSELETIVLKALSKNVADRYATAQAMADDLQRFLEDRPILARRPNVRERMARWTRRNAGLVRAALIVLLLTVVGLATTTLLVAREQAKTLKAYEAEARHRKDAEENFRQAREAVDFFAHVSAEELPNQPELVEVRGKLLSRAMTYYQKFIERRRDDPATQKELTDSQLQVASILERLRRAAEALQAYRQAKLLEEKLKGRYPEGGSDSGVLYLLSQKSVRDELRLTEDQVRQLERLDTPQTEQERDEQERTFLTKLEPEQSRRLRQIALQKRGADAFTDPQVADALELTSPQRERIRALIAERLTKQAPALLDPRVREPTDAPLRRLLEILTPSQRARWQEMIGEPFPFAIPQPPPVRGVLGPRRSHPLLCSTGSRRPLQ